MTAKTAFAALIAVGFVAACEPIPSTPCRPQTTAGGQTIVACTPDGRPILVDPRAQITAPAAPAPVQSSGLGAAPVAAAPYGTAPVSVGATGEPLPPVPATLTPIPAPGTTPAPAPTPSPAPASPGASAGRIVPPPASVSATFPVQ